MPQQETPPTPPSATMPTPSAPARKRPSLPPLLLRRARTWSLCLLYALEASPHQRNWQIDTFLSLRDVLQYAIDRRPSGEGWRPVPLDILPSNTARERFARQHALFASRARTFTSLDAPDMRPHTQHLMDVALSFNLLRQLVALPSAQQRACTPAECTEFLTSLQPLDFAEATPDVFRDMSRFVDALSLTYDTTHQLLPLIPQLDAIIQRSSKKWRVERMASIDRNILRLATFELHHRPQIPPRVSLNEAIELAKTFGSQQARGFVNGILQQICNDNAIALS
jgi:transcription antitermination factor NusB